MLSVLFLSFLILLNQHRLSDGAGIQKPHPACSYRPVEIPMTTTLWPLDYFLAYTLVCRNANLEIPTNFNVSQFPSDVRAVHLDCPHNGTNQTSPYCNVVHANFQPIPMISDLRKASLYGFTTHNGERFPMNILLRNVKHQIEELRIGYSKIGSVDMEYFQGFHALTELNLSGNDIAEIAPNSFQQISESPESSVLGALYMGNNKVISFDLAALEPLASSLAIFSLRSQKPGLQTIVRSTPQFTFKKLIRLHLDGNNLSSIPKEILESINLSQGNRQHEGGIYLAFEANPFCPLSPDCSCCEQKHFFDWLISHKLNPESNLYATFIYDCGPLDNMDRIKAYVLRANMPSSLEISTGKRDADSRTRGEYVAFNPVNGTQCQKAAS